MLIEAIREQISKIEDNEYDGDNGEALRALDLSDLRVLVDRLEEAIDDLQLKLNIVKG